MSSTQDEKARKRVERRSDPRLATRFISAIIEDPQHGTLVFTADAFGRTGAFLRRLDKATPLPRVGDMIKLVLRWPVETKVQPVRVAAKVVRVTEHGVGVQFEIKA